MIINEALYKVKVLKIKKQFPEIWNEVERYNKHHNLFDDCKKFTQQIYNCINKLTSIPLCYYCKINKVKFIDSTEGYRRYCSCKCRANCPENEAKKVETIKKIYGENIINVAQASEVKKAKANTFLELYGNSNPLIAFDKKIKETLFKNSPPKFFFAIYQTCS